MSSLKDVSKKFQDTIKSLEKEMKKMGGEAFYNELKPLFEKYPEVKFVNWTQYTPHFNDGDECTFSVNIYDVLYAYDQDSEDLDDVKISDKAEAEFEELLEGIDEQVFKIVFGDHVKVTIQRDGKVEVDDYEHD